MGMPGSDPRDHKPGNFQEHRVGILFSMTKATFGEIMKAPTRLLLAIAAISLFPLVGSARAEKQTEPQAAGPSEGAEQGTGASLAYTRDARKNLPALTQPDHFVKTWEAVAVQPQVPSRFPEELDRQTLPSPDPLPAGLAWDGKRLWVAGRKATQTLSDRPANGKRINKHPVAGRLSQRSGLRRTNSLAYG